MHLSDITINSGDKVLVIALRAMGDTLLATPLIRDIKGKFPMTTIDVVAESLPAQVLEGNSNISKILISPNRGSWIGAYSKLYLKLLKTNYKASIDLISTPGSALISFVANARIRVGYRLRGRTWAYNVAVKRQSNNNYSALSKYDLTEDLNVTCTSPIPVVSPLPQHTAWADSRMQELKIDFSKPIIGISPWSKRVWRRWEMDNWIRLLIELRQHGEYQAILFASNSERPFLKLIENTKDYSLFWADTSHIHQAAAMMKSCDVVLTADNGLKHIAVAMNTPTFTVYTDYEGVSPHAWNPPDRTDHQFLVAPKLIDENTMSSVTKFIWDEIEH